MSTDIEASNVELEQEEKKAYEMLQGFYKFLVGYKILFKVLLSLLGALGALHWANIVRLFGIGSLGEWRMSLYSSITFNTKLYSYSLLLNPL